MTLEQNTWALTARKGSTLGMMETQVATHKVFFFAKQALSPLKDTSTHKTRCQVKWVLKRRDLQPQLYVSGFPKTFSKDDIKNACYQNFASTADVSFPKSKSNAAFVLFSSSAEVTSLRSEGSRQVQQSLFGESSRPVLVTTLQAWSFCVKVNSYFFCCWHGFVFADERLSFGLSTLYLPGQWTTFKRRVCLPATGDWHQPQYHWPASVQYCCFSICLAVLDRWSLRQLVTTQPWVYMKRKT